MRLCSLFALLLSAALPVCSFAQTDRPKLAAYESLVLPTNVAKQATFTKAPAKQGDRIDQQLEVSLEMKSTVRRGQQVVDTSDNTIGRTQHRTVLIDRVGEGKTSAARVYFSKYDRRKDTESVKQPVVGNTYACVREADDTLTVTRADGSFATPDEFSLVSESMVALGRPNPMADFLDGRTLKVGETVEVPKEVGDALLSADGTLGTVATFRLTLLEHVVDQNLARFQIEMETAGAETTQLKLSLAGELVVESDTCRTRAMSLSGPLAMATTIGSYSSAETTFVSGKLNVQMQAKYSK
ncbi:hypothetical protein [Aeoliella mucimassa]|uniref:Uncharacterized protein n=1 Tax=Aeoliella mucimassa TaxID=2527972 RepID=A0A518AWI5_9BACT|nr:hypothetical protein [Aeoliella mucimassa]QDU59095.1 hypothetical protein Pan181_53360 [Aeoliella mucimassa]